MALSRRCFICNTLLDPAYDEGYLLQKGVGGYRGNLHTVAWLCAKHGKKLADALEGMKFVGELPRANGKKRAASIAANGGVK